MNKESVELIQMKTLMSLQGYGGKNKREKKNNIKSVGNS